MSKKIQAIQDSFDELVLMRKEGRKLVVKLTERRKIIDRLKVSLWIKKHQNII